MIESVLRNTLLKQCFQSSLVKKKVLKRTYFQLPKLLTAPLWLPTTFTPTLLKRWFFKGSLVKKKVLLRTMNIQRTFCKTKEFFASWKGSSECAVDGSIQNLFEKGAIQHQTWFFYCYDVKVVTTEEPFLVLYITPKRFYIEPSTSRSLSIRRTISQCKETFNHSK